MTNEFRLNYAGSTYKDMCVTVEDIEAAIKNLKKNKIAVADHIVAEHVIYCHPCLIVLLKLLFHVMLLYGYVPNDFATGIIVPLIKDKSGDLTSAEYYRPITLSPVISKVFESVLVINCGEFLSVNDRQFGLKKIQDVIMRFLFCTM